jgi:hypothetical protein
MSPRRRDIDLRLGGTVLHKLARLRRAALQLTSLALSAALLAPLVRQASAFTVTIASGHPETVYLQVGVGTITGGNGTYAGGGTPGNNATVNHVFVTVPAGSVGNHAAQTMTTDSTASANPYNGNAYCSVPTQLYVGGMYRRNGNGGGGTVATLTATVPASLTTAGGATIPFSDISWTSGGTGDTGAEPFPAATFVAGSTQTIGTIARDQWAASCLTFSYNNTTVPVAGTYTGTVTYTLSAP